MALIKGLARKVSTKRNFSLGRKRIARNYFRCPRKVRVQQGVPSKIEEFEQSFGDSTVNFRRQLLPQFDNSDT